MTQTFHAPPPNTVIEDTPYGHALIERYMPWLLANRMDTRYTEAKGGTLLNGLKLATKTELPWVAKATPEHLKVLFTQDTELPMPVPPIGTVVGTIDSLKQQYPDFLNILMDFPENKASEYVRNGIVIAHPSHSVIVSFVEPVEVETETPEPKESEEPTVKKSIVTTMDKILRPEDGYVIRTPEEVEKFLVFLLLHKHNCNYVTQAIGDWLTVHTCRNSLFLPYTVKGVNPDYGDIFITEAELAQAEAEAQQVEAEKAKSLLLPTVELLQNRVRELEKELIHDLIPLKNNVNTLFQLMGEQKPF